MSRAFVKEPDADAVDDLPDRPVSEHVNYVTAAGLAEIEESLRRLREDWTAAQKAGDRAALARTARDLRYWNARRASAQPVPPPPADGTVHFGSTVTIARDDGRRQTFRIVGEDEADPARGTLSYVSPMARALLRRAEGDVLQVAGHAVEIVEVG
ncbi:MAG: transcription elongation factor GreA [Alphaproteobacteria bacterium]|nr:transcription elongation factor GreA [Alphaproteobacteria bacterium]